MIRPGLLTALAVAAGIALGGVVGGDKSVALGGCVAILALCAYHVRTRGQP